MGKTVLEASCRQSAIRPPQGMAAGKGENGRGMSKTSPTQRTLAALRERGYVPAITERWNPWARIRQDLYGFIDVLALHPETGETLAVQTTSASNVSARVAKIAKHENLPIVRRAGWRIEVHGWRKKGREWVCRVVDCS